MNSHFTPGKVWLQQNGEWRAVPVVTELDVMTGSTTLHMPHPSDGSFDSLEKLVSPNSAKSLRLHAEQIADNAVEYACEIDERDGEIWIRLLERDDLITEISPNSSGAFEAVQWHTRSMLVASMTIAIAKMRQSNNKLSTVLNRQQETGEERGEED